MRRTHGYPALTYFRAGDPDRPVLVFLPGGGHLARVAYGHPDCRRQDFLDYWLAEAGFGLLAISYPSDHAVYDTLHPAMTITEWGALAAEIARELLIENGHPRRLVLAGWSMAGRAVRAFSSAAAERRLQLDAFISLAATAPLFLNSDVAETFRLTPNGLREVLHPPVELMNDRRFIWWRAALAEQARLNEREIIDEALYHQAFRANHPANLNGEVLRYRGGRLQASFDEAITDMGSFDYGAYPLTGCVIPDSISDLSHAVTDEATWSFINHHKIMRGWLGPLAAQAPHRLGERWQTVRQMLDGLPRGLSSRVPGSHLFFIGALSARLTALAISDLTAEISRITADLDRLVAPTISAGETTT